MNPSALTVVTFGDQDGLREMLWENSQQHDLYRQVIGQRFSRSIPAYPIADADFNNLDDWLLIHFQVHQAEDRALGLSSPFNLLDVDWNKEADFYEWLSSHADAMQQRANALGL